MRQIFLGAAIFPRKYGRSVILERPYILGNFVAATIFPGDEISCDTPRGRCGALRYLHKLHCVSFSSDKSSFVVVTISLVEKQGLLKMYISTSWQDLKAFIWWTINGLAWHCYLLQSLLIVTLWFQAFLCVTNEVLCSSSSCKHKLMFCHTKSSPTPRWSNSS